MTPGRSKQGRWRCWKAVLVCDHSWLNLIWKDRWEWRHKLWLCVCGEPLRMLSIQLRRWLLHWAEPLNGSCPSICPSNLPGLPSLRKSFRRGCSRRSMLHDFVWLGTERTSCTDPHMLRPLSFPVPLTGNLLILSVQNTLNGRKTQSSSIYTWSARGGCWHSLLHRPSGFCKTTFL